MTGPEVPPARRGVFLLSLFLLLLVAGAAMLVFFAQNDVMCGDWYGVTSGCAALYNHDKVASTPWLALSASGVAAATVLALAAPSSWYPSDEFNRRSPRGYARWWRRTYTRCAVLLGLLGIVVAFEAALGPACLAPCTAPGYDTVLLFAGLLYPLVAVVGGVAFARWKW